jgi:hypothetical protein
VVKRLFDKKVRHPNKTLTVRRFAAIIFHPRLFKAAPKKRERNKNRS